MTTRRLSAYAPSGMPEVQPGDNLAQMITDALLAENEHLCDGDILAVAHKIISKNEGHIVCLADVCPTEAAMHFAGLTGKDPALVDIILRESTAVMRWARNGPLICRHRLGFVCANAGVDESNAAHGVAVLLPSDPDKSARVLREQLESIWRVRLGVLVCDTHGRPFREGACGLAIGLSGFVPLKDYIGRRDRAGRVLESTREAVADELAAAATLVMGQGDEGRPVAVLRGYPAIGEGSAMKLLRNPQQDLFL